MGYNCNNNIKELFMKFNAEINGKHVELDISANTLLVDLIRDNLHLTGTHVGCDSSQCGACTVLVDNQSIKSCNVLAMQVSGKKLKQLNMLKPILNIQNYKRVLINITVY